VFPVSPGCKLVVIKPERPEAVKDIHAVSVSMKSAEEPYYNQGLLDIRGNSSKPDATWLGKRLCQFIGRDSDSVAPFLTDCVRFC
jgi:hypothetical protein